MEAEDVVARADRLRAALDWADTLAAESDAALGRYSGGVDRLAALVAPTVERTQALRAARDEVRAALATAERALTHLDAPRQLEAAVLAGPEADLPAFVDALGRLDETVAFLKAHSGLAAADAARESAAALRADGGALALRNFETLLRLHSSSGGRAGARAAGAGDGGQSGALPDAVVARLRLLADVLLRTGDTACVKAYVDVRAAALHDALTRDAEPSTPTEGGWGGDGVADAGVGSWTKNLRALVQTAASERDTASAIFSAPHDEAAFASVAGDAVDRLVQTGRAIVTARRTGDKAAALLDMYDALGSVSDDLAATLAGPRFLPLLTRLAELADAAQDEFEAMFADFEAGLARPETWKAAVTDGSVHPAVAQTLAHLDALLAHSLAPQLLLPLAPASSVPAKTAPSASSPASHPSPVAVLVDRVLTELESALDAKARTCKCKIQAAVFVLNNVTYAMSTAGSSPALAPHAATWLASHAGAIDARLRDLRAVLWAPTADAVNTARVGGTLSKDAAKAVAAGVAALDDARAAYAVVDAAVRARVHDAVEAELVVPYESLCADNDAAARALRHTPAALRALLADFFELRDDRDVASAPRTTPSFLRRGRE